MPINIAIITHYHASENYGGNLQAYALCKTIKQLGYHAVQLQISASKQQSNSIVVSKSSRLTNALKKSPTYLANAIIRKLKHKTHKKEVKHFLSSRSKAFYNFHYCLIPHSDNIYTYENIIDSLKSYDTFIVGSDQVWNPIWYTPIYRLEFVPANVPKFSYAASVAVTELTQEQQNIFCNALADYIGVSVREIETVGLLESLSPVKPVCSLDPTLLLSRQDWDTICAEALIDMPYMFCYFLDEGKKLRKLAHDYAKKHGLKVVAIPFLMNTYNSWDKRFSDILIPDASPEKFISLIKHAEIVFTDSFHASVFSSIYQRDFFVFRRAIHHSMSTRLYTLTELFGSQKHFCDTEEKETLNYLEHCSPIDYTKQQKYHELKKESIAYLKEMLEKSERMLNQNEV